MPRLTNEEVLKIGKLARLDIAPDELDSLADHFNSILDYFSKLDENMDLTIHIYSYPIPNHQIL